MNLAVKNLALFMPFAAGILYGLNYALNGRILISVSTPTWMIFWCSVGIITAIGVHLLKPLKISLQPLLMRPTIFMALISVSCSMMAWILINTAIRNISATYAAIGEVSYALFTVVFGYLIFGRHIDWTTALGGLLIITGSIIVIAGKTGTGG